MALTSLLTQIMLISDPRIIMWLNKVIALNKPWSGRLGPLSEWILYMLVKGQMPCTTQVWKSEWHGVSPFLPSHSDWVMGWKNTGETFEVAHTAHQVLKYFSIFYNILYKQNVCTCAVYLIYGGKIDPQMPSDLSLGKRSNSPYDTQLLEHIPLVKSCFYKAWTAEFLLSLDVQQKDV